MKKLLVLLCFSLLTLLGHAQVLQVKGVGTVSYTGVVTPEIKEKAYVKAQVAAVERYYAESGESEAQNFEAIQDKVAENLEKFILSTTVLNEQDQPSFHKYSVSARVELNVTKLKNTLRGSTAVGQANTGSKSQLVYLFMGREADSVRSYDARVFQRVDVGTKEKAGNASVQIETGGSTTRKADETTYKLLPMSNYTTSISSVFTQNGFVVVEPFSVIGDKDSKAINKDFSTGSDLSSTTLRSVVGTLYKAKIPYLIIATLDAGAPNPDPATGMARVGVTVTARVLDLTNTLPREVASVPAVQYFGVGPDNQAATVKSLKDASLTAAREVVSRLNTAGIR